MTNLLAAGATDIAGLAGVAGVIQISGKDQIKPDLEARYDVWIAAKKRKSDFYSAILSSVLVLCYTACMFTKDCKPTLVHPAGEFIAIPCWLWLMLCNPGRYAQYRNHLFACMQLHMMLIGATWCRIIATVKPDWLLRWWYSASSVFIGMHRQDGAALEPRKTLVKCYFRLLILKWPYLLFYMLMFPTKLSWVPLVHFVSLLTMNLGAYNAAAVFAPEISVNIPIMRITDAVNGTLRRLLEGFALVLNGVSEGLVNQRPGSDPLLSPRQCILAVWLLVQGAAFWVGFWMLARAERRNRVAFLQFCRLGPGHALSNVGVKEMRLQLCAIEMYVAVLLLAASVPKTSSLAG